MYYPELEELFSSVSDCDRRRLICRYILNLSTEQISFIEKCSPEAIYQSFRRAELKLTQLNKANDFWAVMDEVNKNINSRNIC